MMVTEKEDLTLKLVFNEEREALLSQALNDDTREALQLAIKHCDEDRLEEIASCKPERPRDFTIGDLEKDLRRAIRLSIQNHLMYRHDSTYVRDCAEVLIASEEVFPMNLSIPEESDLA